MQTELNYDTVFDAQQHFRLFLDSMSRPGKINTLPFMELTPPAGLQQAAALAGFALLNSDVTFYVAGEDSDSVASYLLVNTSSRHADMGIADYVFLPEGYYADDLYDARTGTSVYPEESATLIVQSELISNEPVDGSIQIILKGPGVNGEAKVFIAGIAVALLEFVKVQNDEYPLGLDLIISDRENNIVCIPRSNKFTWV
jgi:alpha-D-ribose 1-methylphosphonate 5-triphosphate synthase subunit PhnH